MAYVVGTALGYSNFRRRTAQWLMLCYMLVMLPIQWTLVIDQNTSLEEQLVSVAGRLYFSTSNFLAHKPVDDPIFFIAVMCIAFWIISALAGFTLVRHQNYLGAVLPAAIGLLIIQNYDNGVSARLWFLAFFAFIALLLLGRLQFLQNKKSWHARRVFLSPDNTIDLTSSMAIATGLIIIISWTVPASISGLNSAVQRWSQLTRPWRDFAQKMENAVSALQSSTNTKPGEFIFGSELALGRGFPNTGDLVFIAHAPDLPTDQEPPRYYWRGHVYDLFSKGAWHTTGTSQDDFSPVALPPPSSADPSAQDIARFGFQVGESKMSLLYEPAQPIWVSRSGTRLTSSTEAEEKEVIAWNASPELLPGEAYLVDLDRKKSEHPAAKGGWHSLSCLGRPKISAASQ